MPCCYSCLVKTNAFIAALLSCAVLVFTCIVLASSVTYARQNNTQPQTNSSNVTYNPPQTNNSDSESIQPTSTIFPPLKLNNENASLTSNLTVFRRNENNDPKSTSSLPEKPEHWKGIFQNHDFWKDKSPTYIILMQASSGTGVFAALLQLGFSWLLICGSARDLKDRTNLWNLSNFIVLILIVVIILVPLSYNNATDTFKATSVFQREIRRRVMSVEFSYKTLQIILDSVSNFLEKDLTLYYYVLGVDAFILLTFLIPPLLYCLCYPCRRCCCKKKTYKRSDSDDIMLFETGSDAF